MSFLKAELHCHVKLFSRRAFRPAQLQRRLNRARQLGLNVLAVTEHVDVPDFWEICKHLESLCTSASGSLNWKGLTVLTGAEVSVSEGGDILLIGSLEAIKELEGRLGRLSPWNSPSFKRLLDASEDLGFLRIGAHPCRPNKELWKMGTLLKRLDALEINAGELSEADWVQHQAKQLNLPVLAGSDAHHWLQIGRVFNLLPLSTGFTVADIKEALAQKKITWQKAGFLPLVKSLFLKIQK